MSIAAIKTKIEELIHELYYLSESERPLELLAWDSRDEDALYKQIADFTGLPANTMKEEPAGAFFDKIERMADPNDEAMQDYTRRYAALKNFLLQNLTELKVITGGAVEVHIFITGFISNGRQAVVLHTTAIQT